MLHLRGANVMARGQQVRFRPRRAKSSQRSLEHVESGSTPEECRCLLEPAPEGLGREDKYLSDSPALEDL
jgi:hypothetical protein